MTVIVMYSPERAERRRIMRNRTIFGREKAGRLGAHMLLLLAVLTLAAMLFHVKPVHAAKLKKSAKPKFVLEECRQSSGNAILTWKKTKGAKKYIVFRSTKKNGGYKKFATTKKLTITKKSDGEYFYKVQAVSGKVKSKMSAPVHLFSATGNIYHAMSLRTSYFGGGSIVRYYYCALKNNTKKTMTFTKDGACSIMQMDLSTRETKEVNTGIIFENATIKAGKDGTFTVRTGAVYLDSDTILIVKVPFKAGGQTWYAFLGDVNHPAETWIGALGK